MQHRSRLGDPRSLTLTTALVLISLGTAQCSPSGGQPGLGSSATASSPSGPTLELDSLERFQRLGFPYGVQSFEQAHPGSAVRQLAGWEQLGASARLQATIVEGDPGGPPRPGTPSRRWLRVEDLGATAGEGLCSRTVVAPAPWNYSWSLRLRIEQPPTGAGPLADWPVLVVQHDGPRGLQDVWGLRFTARGAQLFLTTSGGTPDSAPLFRYQDHGRADWVEVQVVASLERNQLLALVDGVPVARLALNPPASTRLQRQRLAYHGSGAGTSGTLLLDDLVLDFTSPVCHAGLFLDFSADGSGRAFPNGQALPPGSALNDVVTLFSSGPNAGAALFDSTRGGPNDPSQDLDLLVGQGNLLILQTDASTLQSVPGIFDRPNDDEDGGALSFAFARPLQPLTVDLVDIDSGPGEDVQVRLSDSSGHQRVYRVPADWTGDRQFGGPGVGTLDLTTLADQRGWNSTATAVTDPGYDARDVVALVIELGSSGAIDNLRAALPCVQIDFETEDDGLTALVNGQDISTPPEFGRTLSISGFGPNAGPAIFDSTPTGPNMHSQDVDLLVGLGNVLILQNSSVTTQSVPGIFDRPNDDQDGGTITFAFPGPVQARQIDVIDIDPGDPGGLVITLIDSSGLTCTFTVPSGFTEDLIDDGPPAFRTLSLRTRAPQPGFMATATSTEDPGFDPDDVVAMRVDFGSSGAIDNLCFCP